MKAKNFIRALGAALVLATAGAATNAQAVPYPLPTNGYYQLQNATTFRTVCETGRGACDVSPGEYVLIDFRVNPARRQNVTVAAGGTGGTGSGGNAGGLSSSGFVLVSETCAFDRDGRRLNAGSGFRSNDNVASCAVSCPANAPRLYGAVSCDGTVAAGTGVGREIIDILGTSFLSSVTPNNPEGLTCSTDELDNFIDPSPVSGNLLIVRATCGPR